MTVVIACLPCGTNHTLTARDAEDLIQALAADLATEEAEGNVFTNPAETETGDQRTYAWCAVQYLSTVRDGEYLAEHLESMRESRLGYAKDGAP